MHRMKLSEWAQVGEVVGMVAVVLSLLLVVYSIDQNTQALRGSNVNILFERHAELTSHFIADPSMAEILVKMRQPDRQLTEVEAVRWEKYRLNLLDIWAMAWGRQRQSLLTDEGWEAWNTYFADTFSRGTERLGRAEWESLKPGFETSFWQHVGRELGYLETGRPITPETP